METTIHNAPKAAGKQPSFPARLLSKTREVVTGARFYILLLLAGMAISYMVAHGGVAAGMMVIVACIAIPVLYVIMAYPRAGIIVLMIAAYLIMWVIRMGVNFPLGTMIDVIELLLILSFFMQQKKKPDWQVFKGPVAKIVLIWIAYNILEFANPSAESRLAWMYTVRSSAAVMLMYFIFCHYITTVAFMRLVIKLWLALSFFAALYAFKQEQIGFFPFEEAYLFSDPKIRFLLFIGGSWRKFSIFSDPVAFAYNMVVSTLLCIGLISGPLPLKKKLILGFLAFFFVLTMFYSGTRGAYVLLPAALLMFAILNCNRKVLIYSAIAAFFLAVLILMPTGNPTIRRFQTAFAPSDDPSYLVRKANQKRIQPFILTHPMGGGLGATGVWGVRFAPWSFLASFPPDSGYVRTAVEIGSIGLFLICTLMFVILKTGINNFYTIRDPELKSYCLSMVLMIFAYAIGNFPQEALVQFPSNIYFFLVTAIIYITKRLDNEKYAKETGNAAIVQAG